jgi:hypothetical protein
MVKAFDDCQGRIKLQECIAGLKQSAVYSLDMQPEELPENDFPGVCNKLGVPEAERTYANVNALVLSWKAHRRMWKPDIKYNLAETYTYYQKLAGSHPLLSKYARLHLLRPISAASCERVFSKLTLMDRSNRRNMETEILEQTLFLTANWRIVHLLADQYVGIKADGKSEEPLAQRLAGTRRAREEESIQKAQKAQLTYEADAKCSNEGKSNELEADDRTGEAEFT